jgi:putative addiction module antidote
MYKLKIIQIGNSLGVTLPKEALAAMNLDKGDTLTLTAAPDGFRVTPYDPDVERQIEAGREFMREYRDTLRALAK